MGAIANESRLIDVAQRGGGDRTPILFLHGARNRTGMSGAAARSFWTRTPGNSLVLSGYGASDFLPDAHRDDYGAAAGDERLMDALAIERAHICGLSLGGVVAIALHAAAPRRCCVVVLADTFAVHPDARRSSIDRKSQPAIGMRALARPALARLLASAAGPAIHRTVIDTMSAIDPAAYVLAGPRGVAADQRDRAAVIDVATLVLVATKTRSPHLPCRPN